MGVHLDDRLTQAGMVAGSTNKLLAKVRGESSVMLSCMTDSVVFIFSPTAVHTQERG